ncbi:hypothetical protein Tco_0283142 [Tanacetum coccineum]
MIVMMSIIELESLFGPLFDEYFKGENQVVSKSSAVTTVDASNKRQQQPDSTSSTSTLATTVTADGNFDLFIKAIYGEDGAPSSLSKRSPWLDIIREVTVLRTKGINLLDLIHKKVGNGLNTLFWEDPWLDDFALKHKLPRHYALDNYKEITVVEKINHASMVDTFHRPPRGGAEEEQLGFFIPHGCLLIKVMPIKINVFVWRVHLDKLPTRLNISLKGEIFIIVSGRKMKFYGFILRFIVLFAIVLGSDAGRTLPPKAVGAQKEVQYTKASQPRDWGGSWGNWP